MTKDINIWTVVLSIVSSVITAIITYFLNANKTKAEIAKLKAETDKIIAETKTLSTKLDTALENNTSEIIYYDSVNPSNFDFEALKQKRYDNSLGKEYGERAGGDFSIMNNILNIERTDSNGRFGLLLKSYKKGNDISDCIKVDPAMGQERKIHVTCEIKSLNNKKHTLELVLRNIDSFEWIAQKRFMIQSYEWTKCDAFFRVAPNKSFRLKFYDTTDETSPNSIQIKNLKVVERY